MSRLLTWYPATGPVEQKTLDYWGVMLDGRGTRCRVQQTTNTQANMSTFDWELWTTSGNSAVKATIIIDGTTVFNDNVDSSGVAHSGSITRMHDKNGVYNGGKIGIYFKADYFNIGMSNAYDYTGSKSIAIDSITPPTPTGARNGDMIVLYDIDETLFVSNGLGTLSDATSCLVSEELNGEFELEMEYPVNGKRFNDLADGRIICAKPNPYAEKQAFRIYSITKPIDGIITVNAHHISYDLSGYMVLPFSSPTLSDALYKLTTNAATSVPFSFQTNISSSVSFVTDIPTSIRSLLGNNDGLIGTYGGEYEFDNFLVKLLAHRGENRGVTIRYGKNMTNMSHEENITNLYSGILPFWKKGDESVATLPEKVLYFSDTHPLVKIYPLDLSQDFETRPSESALRSAAETYMQNHDLYKSKISLKVSFINLSRSEEYANYAPLETVRIGDIVTVENPVLNVNSQAQCVRTEFDALTGEYKSIELGETESTITDTIAKQDEKITAIPSVSTMERIAQRASSLISGNLGGYVLIHSSTGGSQPDEILIMDTDNITTATKVWRWNQSGFGYSSTGYDGPYSSAAITMDGEIVADFITAGVLNGGLLAADSITSAAISQEYKSLVTNEISQSSLSLEQAFTAADGQLRSEIQTVEQRKNDDLELINTKISEINQTIDGITFSFSQNTIGGINLVRNSSGLNGLSDDWIYSGSVGALQTTDATSNTNSGSMFRVGNSSATGLLTQDISVKTNETYTISFLAKISTNSLCTVKLQYGDSIITVLSVVDASSTGNGDWKEYTKTFQSGSNSVTLSISGGGTMYIADIIIVEGPLKSNWMPAPNELYTTDVKIDRKGINITNSESSTETVIDNTQFAVKHNGNIVLTVNKDLTTLSRTNISDELTVGKTRFIPTADGMSIVLLD